MIDLHVHILPGVDDGPASPEQALAMATALVQAGTHTVVATPHFHDWTRAILPHRGAIAERVGALRTYLAEHGVALTVLPGGECFLSPELIASVQSGDAPGLGDGPYLLVELPIANTVVHPEYAVAELHRHGATVLLAHAERYPFVQRNPSEALLPLLSCGAAIQVSLGSLGTRAPSGQRKAAERLLTAGLVHVLASDAHAVRHIETAAALRGRAADLVGADNYQLLTEENPRRVLAGEVALSCAPVEPSPSGRRRWWSFGR